MSAITFAVEIDPKKKKSGLHEIRVRMTQSRKHKRFNIGYAIEEKHWNKDKRRVRASHPLSTIINAAITTKVNELEKQYLETIPLHKNISIEELQRKAKNEIGGEDFIAFFRERIATYKNGSTKATVERVCNKLEQFMKGKTLFFAEIDHSFLEKFENHLRKNLNNQDNTVHHNIRTLKAIYNQALVQKRYEPNGISPFFGYKLTKGKTSRNKLQLDEIELIENYELPEGTNIYHAKNFFLLSFYLMGVRASSMIKMKWSNIVGNRCIYTAAKGEKAMDIIIHKKAISILEYYRKANLNKSEYIFPFLKKGEIIDLQNPEHAKKIEALTSLINNNLEKIRERLGITKRITTHVARHSFAYNARKISGNDIYAVQKALGHSSISVTENYFGSEEVIEADELSKKLFGE